MFIGFFTAGCTVLIQLVLKEYGIEMFVSYFMVPLVFFSAKILIERRV